MEAETRPYVMGSQHGSATFGHGPPRPVKFPRISPSPSRSTNSSGSEHASASSDQERCVPGTVPVFPVPVGLRSSSSPYARPTRNEGASVHERLIRSVSLESDGPDSPQAPSDALFPSISRDDAYGIRYLVYNFQDHNTTGDSAGIHYHHQCHATSVAPEYEYIDPDAMIYGCSALRCKLKSMMLNAAMPANQRGAPFPDDRRLMWHASHYGSGTRMLAETLCKKYRTNLVVAFTQAPRNTAGVCTDVPYREGVYSELLRLAISLAPCVLFIDRIDPHFECQYEKTGHELLGAWETYVEACKYHARPVAEVSILISMTNRVVDCLNYCLVIPYARLRTCETVFEGLSVSECAEILCNTYMHRACVNRLIPYDPQPRSGAGEDSSLMPTVTSTYDNVRQGIAPTAQALGARLHRAAFDAKCGVQIKWLSDTITCAFFRASSRAESMGLTPTDENLREFLPTKEDLEASLMPLLNELASKASAFDGNGIVNA